MTNGLFGLEHEDFWRDPWKHDTRLHERHMLDGDYGLFIDAPTQVRPQRDPSIPVPLYFAAQQREAFKVDVVAQAKIVAVRLEDRRVFVAAAIEPPDNHMPSPKIGRDSSDPVSERHVLDLHRQLGLLDEPGHYRVVVLLTEQHSNVVEIEVEGRSFVHADAEVTQFLQQRRQPRSIVPPDPPTLTLDNTPDDAPAVPDEPGITLAIERVVLLERGAEAWLRGAYNLELRPPHDRVPPPSEWMPDYGEPRPRAILPIDLVIVGSHTTDHTHIRLRIPAFEALADDPVEIQGQFALDLLGYEDLVQRPQTFSIYGFCGEHFVGPAKLATVTHEMLPRPGE